MNKIIIIITISYLNSQIGIKIIFEGKVQNRIHFPYIKITFMNNIL